MSNDAVTM